MQLVGDRTLTSSVGQFTFSPTTRLSHAKLIRDMITAGHNGTLRQTPRPPVNTPDRLIHWVRENIQGPIANDKSITVSWVQV